MPVTEAWLTTVLHVLDGLLRQVDIMRVVESGCR